MKHSRNIIVVLIILVAIIGYAVSHIKIKRPIAIDQGWSPPVVVASSEDSLVGWVYLYKFQNTVMCLQPQELGSTRCFFLNGNSWVESHFENLPKGRDWSYVWGWLTIDQHDDTAIFPAGYIENGQLMMRILRGTLTKNGLRNFVETKWATDERSLFGETDPNVQFEGTNGTGSFYYGTCVLDGSEVYVPYCVSATTITSHSEKGPFNNGVFHSIDFGKTWQLEKISDFNTWVPAMVKTKNNCYYFGSQYNFWFSRKPAGSTNWSTPEMMTKSFTRLNWRGSYAVLADGRTAHACWMDCRHNMWRFNINGPPVENDDIYYCHRNDSDSGWSEGVMLSKGLLYSYWPTISVEGNNIVVAWSGISSAGRHHTAYSPNDIYYVTSKDGGNTWSNPLKVTDKAKDGFVSGKPQVMLLNGVIHLFYIQGKFEKPEELSPGLTRFEKQPWPIYYTQRPFPN